MRYYPLLKNPGFYIETINEWNKYETCHDLENTIERRKNNICGTDVCARFFYPEKAKTPKGKGKGKKKKKKKKKRKMLVRQKVYDKPETKYIRYWNDITGKSIDPIKKEHLIWPDWKKTRLTNNCLPCHIRPTYIKILRGQPPPLPFALLPISLADVLEIKRQDRIAAKLAKKLAKEKKAADKLAKLLALRKGKKK